MLTPVDDLKSRDALKAYWGPCRRKRCHRGKRPNPEDKPTEPPSKTSSDPPRSSPTPRTGTASAQTIADLLASRISGPSKLIFSNSMRDDFAQFLQMVVVPMQMSRIRVPVIWQQCG
jgi:hypothetical protein